MLTLVGCIDETGMGYPVSPGYPDSDRAYNNGFDRGRQDARTNRPRSPERWLGNTWGVSRNQFIRGYNNGYDSQRPSHADAARYYQTGLNAGLGDARRGLSRNPQRHHGGVPARYRSDFNRGYQQGYDRQPPVGAGEVARFERRGRAAAQRDQRLNLDYLPSRHYQDVPRRYRGDFNRGYEAGWRGPRR